LKDVRALFSKKNKPKPQAESVQLAVEFTYLPAAGYSLQTGFAGVLSANAAFRSGKSKDSKLSSLNTSFAYSQYDQIILPLMGNLWSKNGKWNFSVDWRYMAYPSQTWGLAGRRDPNDGYTINFNYLKIHQTALRAISRNLYFGTGFFYDKFWNIRETEANGQPLSAAASTQLRKQGLSGDTEIGSGIPVRLLYDSRLNQINPSNGWYINLTWRDNLRTIGSKRNWQSLVVDIRKYYRITKSGNTLAFWVYSWRSGLKTAYLLLPSTGWDDYYNTGRGYIQGRYRSNIMNYLETEYRFRLTHDGLLGGVVFANVQSYKENLTSGRSVLAPAVGTGIRIKLNKNSGANLCIDYGIGQNGSKGFFVNLGEVF
jgi:outer membrane protein assembly factor BamA